jgi:hypothetical protein
MRITTLSKAGFVAAAALLVATGTAAASDYAFNETFDTGQNTVLDAENADWYGDIQKVRSGKAGNIESGENSKFHALVAPDASYPTGPFTRFDGYAEAGQEFQAFDTSVDVYLDTTWAVGEGFEWDVAANGSDGAHQQDFVIHVQRTETGFLVGANNNSNHPSGVINVPSTDAVTLTDGGWVSLTHKFYDNDGVLAVDMAVDGQSLGTSISPERNAITEVAGNRYGWFTLITVDHVNIDNLTLTR